MSYVRHCPTSVLSILVKVVIMHRSSNIFIIWNYENSKIFHQYAWQNNTCTCLIDWLIFHIPLGVYQQSLIFFYFGSNPTHFALFSCFFFFVFPQPMMFTFILMIYYHNLHKSLFHSRWLLLNFIWQIIIFVGCNHHPCCCTCATCVCSQF